MAEDEDFDDFDDMDDDFDWANVIVSYSNLLVSIFSPNCPSPKYIFQKYFIWYN